MKAVFALLLVCASANAANDAQESGAAIQKVIQMLTDMQAKGRQAKKDEEVAFCSLPTSGLYLCR